MDGVGEPLVLVISAASVVACLFLAATALRRAPRTGSSGRWVAAAFAIGAVVLLTRFLSAHAGMPLGRAPALGVIALTVAYPWLLLRFAATFRSFPTWVEVAIAAGAIAVVAGGVAMVAGSLVSPTLPRPTAETSAAEIAYLVVFLLYWIGASAASAMRLWRAGREQPSIAGRRMRTMGGAMGVLAAAMILGRTFPPSVVADLGTQGTLLASVIAFRVGFAPPRLLRRSWRARTDGERLKGTVDVLRATSVEEVGEALLHPTVAIVGAAGAAMVSPDGEVVATSGDVPGQITEEASDPALRGHLQTRQVVALGDDHGELVLWTSPYLPFFGEEELDLLRNMAAVATLALERVALLENERAHRLALEQTRHEAEVARTEAVEADLAKTEFLSRMSHELRTPLNAILGFGQLLEISSLTEDDRDSVHHIVKAGHHLLALINDVLDLSRIEAGKLTISLEPVHLGQLIDDTVPLIRPLAEGRSITVVTAVGDLGDGFVHTDRQRCRQVLLNLLSNAVKYNRDGGTVTIEVAQPQEDLLRVVVHDTGMGIDADRQALLFEPFERLGAEGSTVEGTGLGLALTRQLVERLGGGIGFASEPGEGSTFWVDLPVTEPLHEPEPVHELWGSEHPTGERTLLLVEDNLANLRLVEAFLRHRPNVTVLPTMQGGLAVELAQEHRPDVVVLDLHLPDLDGREVLLRLRADPRTRDIPVVIASADASPGRVRQLREDGAFDYLTKPLHLATFLAVVDAAVSGSDATPRATDDADREIGRRPVPQGS